MAFAMLATGVAAEGLAALRGHVSRSFATYNNVDIADR